MTRLTLPLAFAAILPALGGCTETFQRLDGVTPAAGDAIAANTVMQMVDPWQYGVQETNLKVPADRGDKNGPDGQGGGGGGSSDDKGTSTSGTY